MPLFENHVGVSVSLDKIRLVELVYNENEFLLENVDEENFDKVLNPSTIEENFVNVLRDSLQKIILRRPLNSKNISFCLDPAFFQVFEVPYDNTLLKTDLIEHFRWELHKLKPMLNGDDYLIQNIELQKIDENSKNNAAVLALKKSIFQSLLKLSRENSLTLKYLDYSHTSSDNLLRFMKTLKGLSGISVFNANDYFSFIILDDFSPLTVIKKRKLKNDLPLDEIKSKLDDLINRRSGLSSFLFSFISGNKITADEINTLNETLKLNFKVLNPFSIIKKSENFSSEIDLLENPSEFASATGVALRLF